MVLPLRDALYRAKWEDSIVNPGIIPLKPKSGSHGSLSSQLRNFEDGRSTRAIDVSLTAFGKHAHDLLLITKQVSLREFIRFYDDEPLKGDLIQRYVHRPFSASCF